VWCPHALQATGRSAFGRPPELVRVVRLNRLLAIYLNHHLAGATAGVELARRALKENREKDYGRFLAMLAEEIAQDRRTLIELMERLGLPRSKVKAPAAWALEKIGRLKLNGRIRGYSPLSRLIELEGLAGGIEAKRAMWLALLQIQANDERLRDFGLELLAVCADDQRQRLEPSRLAAAAEAMCGA
jgi:hypothetical protein